jgi:hypothetical protein
MKIIFSLLMIAIATTAHANSGLNAFPGKYTVDGDCDLLRSAERVYVRSPKTFKGVTSISIDAYGDDASGLEILLGSGQRQAPGTSVRVHGIVTETWVATVTGNKIVSTSNVVRNNTVKVDYTKTIVAERVGDKLLLSKSEVDAPGESPTEETCELVKQ